MGKMVEFPDQGYYERLLARIFEQLALKNKEGERNDNGKRK